MKRREHELYGTRTDNSHAAAVVIKLKCPKLRAELEFIEKHLGNTEHIRIDGWVDSFFYIAVIDNRPGPDALARMRMALTIDVVQDKIFWNDDTSSPAFQGGNCFVRSPRWKSLMKKRFNLGVERCLLEKFHSYSNRDFLRDIKAAKTKS